MGRRAKNKQGPPAPLPGSIPEKTESRRQKTKKRAPSAVTNEVASRGKALKGPGASVAGGRKKGVIVGKTGKMIKGPKGKKVDEVDEDSDLDEALQPGEYSSDEDEAEQPKTKKSKKSTEEE